MVGATNSKLIIAVHFPERNEMEREPARRGKERGGVSTTGFPKSPIKSMDKFINSTTSSIVICRQ